MKVEQTMTAEEEAAWVEEVRRAKPPNPDAIAEYRRGQRLDTVEVQTAVKRERIG